MANGRNDSSVGYPLKVDGPNAVRLNRINLIQFQRWSFDISPNLTAYGTSPSLWRSLPGVLRRGLVTVWFLSFPRSGEVTV